MTRTKQTRLTNLPKGYVSQYTMAEKVAAKGWTDTEKVSPGLAGGNLNS